MERHEGNLKKMKDRYEKEMVIAEEKKKVQEEAKK